MIFIGIDLAWTYKNETGLCVMNDSGSVLRHEAAVFSNEALVEIIMNYESEEVCVGIDAAVIVNNVNGSRKAEGLMMRDRFHGHSIQAFNSNRHYLLKTFGDIRGEEIYKLLKVVEASTKVTNVFGNCRVRVMEVFPTGVSVGMFPELYPLKYKIKSKVPFDVTKRDMSKILEQLHQIENRHIVSGLSKNLYSEIDLMSKKQYKHLEDQLDAFLCAYGMFMVYKNLAEQRIYGDELDGFMMVPVVK